MYKVVMFLKRMMKYALGSYSNYCASYKVL